jgi:hypothetical protein
MATFRKFSPLTTEQHPTTEQSSRTVSPMNMVAVLHHAATTNLDQVIDMMQPGGRQVSAHIAMKDSRIAGVVVEGSRAWSLGDAYWDSVSFTVECANQSTTGWTISSESQEGLAQLVADWSTNYGVPIVRGNGIDPKKWTVIGHSEVYTIHGGSYATACPGAMDLNWIANRAIQIQSGEEEEPNMLVPVSYVANDRRKWARITQSGMAIQITEDQSEAGRWKAQMNLPSDMSFFDDTGGTWRNSWKDQITRTTTFLQESITGVELTDAQVQAIADQIATELDLPTAEAIADATVNEFAARLSSGQLTLSKFLSHPATLPLSIVLAILGTIIAGELLNG